MGGTDPSEEPQLSFEFTRPSKGSSTFVSRLLAADDHRIVLTHPVFPSRPLCLNDEEVIGPGYRAVWFLFKGEPYDIGRFYRPDGTFTGYYVDVLEPVWWTGNDPRSLAPLVDLFLDLWISLDGDVTILDEDELGDALQNGAISPEQAARARHALQDLIVRCGEGAFPPSDVRDFGR